MLPPLLRLILDEPGLLAEHLDAYASLVQRDIDLWRTQWERRLLLKALLGISAFLTLLFIGIALMIWGTRAEGEHEWLLIVVPLAPLVLTALVALMMTGGIRRKPFEASRKQLCADLRILKGDGR